MLEANEIKVVMKIVGKQNKSQQMRESSVCKQLMSGWNGKEESGTKM